MMAAAAAAGAVMGPASPVAGAAAVVQEVAARDAMLGWFRGEFAAANAIIDALCAHLSQTCAEGEYDAVFIAVHRRRLNWIPVLQMQKYFSIADVANELRRATAAKMAAAAEVADVERGREEEEEIIGGCGENAPAEAASEVAEDSRCEAAEAASEVAEDSRCEAKEEKESSEGDPSDPKIPDQASVGDDGSQNGQASSENFQICSNHDSCVARPDRIMILKGFVAKEQLKGQMVNVVKGLKLYEDIFTDSELLKLAGFIDELHIAGRKGELSGDTFIYFNKEMKGNKREIIQLGAPLFQPTREGTTGNNEPIPPVLQTVIDHLVQWNLIPESRKPNSCIINFFDEDEHSQPYQKPPHLDNPISTLVLSETTMAFGRTLVCDSNGNYKGSLTLQLKEGSLLVMRGNSAEMARHVVCPSSNRRVIVTLVKVRSVNKYPDSPAASPLAKAMTLWQPAAALPNKVPGVGAIGYTQALAPTWGMALPLRTPVFMLAPRPIAMSPARKVSRNGTGVFLPWTTGHKKYTRHLPPRIQKRRLLSLPSPVEA